MKHIYIISLGGLILLMGMFFLVLTVQSTDQFKFKKTAREMLDEVKEQDHYFPVSRITDIRNLAEQYQLVDLRTPGEFMNYHLQGAINIPFDRILDKENERIFRNDITKILYDNSQPTANAAWMVLTQFGYENIVVLNGGFSTWSRMNEIKEQDILDGIRDEKPEFDFAGLMKQDP
jgi:rhodanese-related sulfurtransferase